MGQVGQFQFCPPFPGTVRAGVGQVGQEGFPLKGGNPLVVPSVCPTLPGCRLQPLEDWSFSTTQAESWGQPEMGAVAASHSPPNHVQPGVMPDSHSPYELIAAELEAMPVEQQSPFLRNVISIAFAGLISREGPEKAAAAFVQTGGSVIQRLDRPS